MPALFSSAFASKIRALPVQKVIDGATVVMHLRCIIVHASFRTSCMPQNVLLAKMEFLQKLVGYVEASVLQVLEQMYLLGRYQKCRNELSVPIPL